MKQRILPVVAVLLAGSTLLATEPPPVPRAAATEMVAADLSNVAAPAGVWKTGDIL